MNCRLRLRVCLAEGRSGQVDRAGKPGRGGGGSAMVVLIKGTRKFRADDTGGERGLDHVALCSQVLVEWVLYLGKLQGPCTVSHIRKSATCSS